MDLHKTVSFTVTLLPQYTIASPRFTFTLLPHHTIAPSFSFSLFLMHHHHTASRNQPCPSITPLTARPSHDSDPAHIPIPPLFPSPNIPIPPTFPSHPVPSRLHSHPVHTHIPPTFPSRPHSHPIQSPIPPAFPSRPRIQSCIPELALSVVALMPFLTL